MHFHKYLKICHFFQISQFLWSYFVGYFKSQISKCPDLSVILPHFLTNIMPYKSIYKQMFLYHLIIITLYHNRNGWSKKDDYRFPVNIVKKTKLWFMTKLFFWQSSLLMILFSDHKKILYCDLKRNWPWDREVLWSPLVRGYISKGIFIIFWTIFIVWKMLF